MIEYIIFLYFTTLQTQKENSHNLGHRNYHFYIIVFDIWLIVIYLFIAIILRIDKSGRRAKLFGDVFKLYILYI